MADVYEKLREHLDNLPAGYPATETGVELRILKRLFTEEEASLALKLTMIPEPASGIAARLGEDRDTLLEKLDAMSKKGLIFRSSKGNEPYFMASQFVVGIWEYHLNDLSKELIQDVNEYIPFLMKNSWMTTETKQLRIIPISEKIDVDNTIFPYEAAEEIIRSQKKIVISNCICRKEHQIMDKGCDFPMEACFSFGSGAYYYEENGLGRSIDQEEALEILARGQKAGLVLQPGNSQRPMNICMCCGCCCQILKNLKTLDRPADYVHSNYRARIDADACIACEDCVDRCHMDAISMDDVAVINPDRCIGCGVCVPECPADAVSLTAKNEGETYVPPATIVDTYVAMAKERGIL